MNDLSDTIAKHRATDAALKRARRAADPAADNARRRAAYHRARRRQEMAADPGDYINVNAPGYVGPCEPSDKSTPDPHPLNARRRMAYRRQRSEETISEYVDVNAADYLGPRWPGDREGSKAKHRADDAALKRAKRAADPAADNERQRVLYAREDRVAKRETDKREFELSRPMVAIDSEGQNYKDGDVFDGRVLKDVIYEQTLHDGTIHPVLYKPHATYLWCASSIDGKRRTLVHPDTDMNGTRKVPLHATDILDFLVGLPNEFGGQVKTPRGNTKTAPIFVSFVFNYDVTMILKDMDLPTAYEIIKKEKYQNERNKTSSALKTGDFAAALSSKQPNGKLHWTFWRGFAIDYVKGKWIDIGRLRDPDHPYVTNENGEPIEKDGKKTIDMDGPSVRIFEVYGYFQSPFNDVADSMVKRGAATNREKELIAEMKAKRGRFDNEPIGKIIEYCQAEVRLLAEEMTTLRKALFDPEIGLCPISWHGPGAAVSELYRSKKLKAHFGEHISAEPLPLQSEQQRWAGHAFAGARIEVIKQGYARPSPQIEIKDAEGNTSIDGKQLNRLRAKWLAGTSEYNDPVQFLGLYDVSSAYPAELVELPSLSPACGHWRKADANDPRIKSGGSLAALKQSIEGMSRVSMFQIKYKFPTIYKHKPNIVHTPFFPLFHRVKGGGILFPPEGRGRFSRECALGAISYLQKMFPQFPLKQEHEGQEIAFEIEGAWIWVETAHVRPFEFLRGYYERRKEIKGEIEASGVYNFLEKILKLILNTVYGKTAQTTGQEGKAPPTYNPFYASAITSGCRRRVLEASLVDPFAVVQFATDGIVTTRPLHGAHLGEKSLPRVREKIAYGTDGKPIYNEKGKPIGDEVFLGDWEFSIADAGIYVGSGIYVQWQYGFDKQGCPEMELRTRIKRYENGKPVYDEDGKPVSETVLNEMGFPLKTQKRREVSEKLRGGRPKNYPTNEQGDPWLVAVTVPLWKTSLKGMSAELEPAIATALMERDATFFPYVEQPYKKFIGAGQALTEARWAIVGRWSLDVGDLKWGDLTKRHPGFFYRTIDVHKPGGKGDIYYGNLHDVCNVVIPDRHGKEHVIIAHRASRLIPTIPSLNSDFDAEPRRFKTRERADRYIVALKITAEKAHKDRLADWKREAGNSAPNLADMRRYAREFVAEPLVEWIEADKLWSVWPMMSRARPPSWLKRELIEGTLEIENEDDRMIAATFGGLFSQSETGEGEDSEDMGSFDD